MQRVLVIHNVVGLALLLKGWLEPEFEVDHVTSALAAKESILTYRPTLLIVQLGEQETGIMLVKFLRDNTGIKDLPTFYISGSIVGIGTAPDSLPILGIPCDAQVFHDMIATVLKGAPATS